MLKRAHDPLSQPPEFPRGLVTPLGSDRDNFNLRALPSFLRRRFFPIFATTVAGSLLAIALALSLPPQYVASSVILLDPRQVQFADSTTAAVAAFSGDTAAIESEVELIRSQAVALRVARELLASKVIPAPGDQSSAERALENPDETIARSLASRLEVRRVRQTYLISISYSSPDPATPALVANAFAQAYLDEELDAKRQAIQRAEDLLDSRVADLKQRVQDAESAVEDYRLTTRSTVNLLGKSEADVRLRALERDADAARTFLEAFLARSTQISEQKNLQLPESRIVQLATMPVAPAGPNRLLLATAGVLLSIGLGVGVAGLLEGIDRTVRSGDQASSALGSRLLSSIPTIGSAPGNWLRFLLPRRAYVRARRDQMLRACTQLARSPFSAFSESIRDCRIAMRGTADEASERIFLVTSALPGEGKSTVAAALSHYASRTGENVLLIDMDHRRPMLTQVFAPDSEAGIVELLSGKAAASDVLKRVKDTKVTLLPASRATPNRNANEDERLTQLFDRLRSSYDLIVIDSSPLLPLADARSLVSLVDGVILVVQWGRTTTDALAATLKRSPGLDEKLVGFVLTHVNPGKARLYDPYGSGYDYRRYQTDSRWTRSTK
jgi:capsular exopolysaccharide synthesis family protein